jgi:dipeptidyl aminopeptidase/acylaminoacyl peptidase
LAAAWSTDEQVTAETPPTFLVHASDDGAVVPQNSLRFYDALQRHGVTATLHVFAEGGHGFGMLRGERPADQWPELLEPWLHGRGLTD